MNFYQSRLSHLFNLGFSPKVIYDIGAWKGLWSEQAEEVFTNSSFYLFEANQKNIPFLEKKSTHFLSNFLATKRNWPYFIQLN